VKRDSPLRRFTPLVSVTRIAPVNPDRKAKLREKQFGSRAARVADMACCVCGNAGPSDAAHVKSRGAGGTKDHLVPLCRAHHIQQHAWGIETFISRTGVDLYAVAAKIAAELAA